MAEEEYCCCCRWFWWSHKKTYLQFSHSRETEGGAEVVTSSRPRKQFSRMQGTTNKSPGEAGSQVSNTFLFTRFSIIVSSYEIAGYFCHALFLCRWKETTDNRQFIVERSEVICLRMACLRAINKCRHAARPVVYTSWVDRRQCRCQHRGQRLIIASKGVYRIKMFNQMPNIITYSRLAQSLQ
jgi:hypothetical protein